MTDQRQSCAGKQADLDSELPVLGTGAFTFVPEPGWGNLPPGLVLGDVAAVAVDDRDYVYLFNRGAYPMVVMTREGAFVRSWGGDIFKNPHGIHFGYDGCLYCTDDGDHTVRKCTPNGRVLMQLGVTGQPAPFMSGKPFCRCCHTALSPQGDIYVADGYGNAQVHKYAPDGRYLFSWGESGTDAGQFNLPTTFAATTTGGFTSPTGKTTASRYLTGTGGTSRRAATCTAPVPWP